MADNGEIDLESPYGRYILAHAEACVLYALHMRDVSNPKLREEWEKAMSRRDEAARNMLEVTK